MTQPQELNALSGKATTELPQRVLDAVKAKPAKSLADPVAAKADFEAAMGTRGLIVPKGGAVDDGELHRCDVDAKGNAGKGDGAYLLHLDGLPAGGFQNHRDGKGWENWRADIGRELTPSEREEYSQKMDEREADKAARQADAEKQAHVQISKSALATEDHPYLVAKGVRSCGAYYSEAPVKISPWRASAANVLLIPMRDIADNLRSLQIINPNGDKDFLYGGRVSSCFFPIGDFGTPDIICVAEGYATGASIFEATGFPTAVAFNAGNLPPVAKALHQKYPHARIVLCADDDWKSRDAGGNPINPGVEKATAAAQAVGGILVVPVFENRQDRQTDFNDLAAAAGPDMVREQINAALNRSATSATPPPGGGKSSGSSRSSGLSLSNNEKLLSDPLPLVREIPSAEPYPVDALGPILGPAARALYEEVVQSPLAIACNSVLAGATLAVQGHADIELPTKRVKPIVNDFLSILETGGRKTSTDDHALDAVADYECDLRNIYDGEIGVYKNKHDAWTSEREKIKRETKLNLKQKEERLEILGAEPLPPAFPLVRYSEPTIEGLITKLRYGHPSVGIFTSEGGQFIGGHAMSDDAKRRSTTTLNRIWDGAPIDRVRGGSESFILNGRRISMHLQAQPDVAMSMVNDRSLQDNGYLSRFLIVAPESTAGRRFHKSVSAESRKALELHKAQMLKHLRRPLPYAKNSAGKENRFELKPRVLKFSSAAEERYWQFHDHIESQVGEGGDLKPIAGLANKLAEHAARLAGVLTLFENEAATEVDLAHLDRGIALAEHYASEALRLTSMARVSVDRANAQKLLDWLHTKWPEDHIAIKPLVENGPNALRDTATMKRLIGILSEHHWIAGAPPGTIVDEKPRREAWRLLRKKED